MARAQRPAYWYGEGRSPLGTRMLAAVYAGVSGLRRRWYARGWLRSSHPGVPVIVVGNISVGGTGKTPLTIALVERLRAEGWNPGVASRGYGRDNARVPTWVQANSPPETAGDEPALIASRTGVKLRVDRRRADAARALKEAGCDVVVCDDGLQHYALARDIEIEVIDGRRRYGNAEFLPAGPMREPVERAQRCDFRVVNLGGVAAPAHGGAGFGEWPMRLHADVATPLTGGRARPLASFAGQRVHAVAGIGVLDAARPGHRRGAACLRRPPPLPGFRLRVRQPPAGADDREGRGQVRCAGQRRLLRRAGARRPARGLLGGAAEQAAAPVSRAPRPPAVSGFRSPHRLPT
jgi:tetraacyldisaccharide 4'-kinase